VTASLLFADSLVSYSSQAGCFVYAVSRHGWSGREEQTLGAWLACLSNFVVFFLKMGEETTILP